MNEMKSIRHSSFSFSPTGSQSNWRFGARISPSLPLALPKNKTQVTYRGYMARIRVKGIREENRRRRAATAIQCMVRFRGARNSSAARNRHKGTISIFLIVFGCRSRCLLQVRQSFPPIRLCTVSTPRLTAVHTTSPSVAVRVSKINAAFSHGVGQRLKSLLRDCRHFSMVQNVWHIGCYHTTFLNGKLALLRLKKEMANPAVPVTYDAQVVAPAVQDQVSARCSKQSLL